MSLSTSGVRMRGVVHVFREDLCCRRWWSDGSVECDTQASRVGGVGTCAFSNVQADNATKAMGEVSKSLERERTAVYVAVSLCAACTDATPPDAHVFMVHVCGCAYISPCCVPSHAGMNSRSSWLQKLNRHASSSNALPWMPTTVLRAMHHPPAAVDLLPPLRRSLALCKQQQHVVCWACVDVVCCIVLFCALLRYVVCRTPHNCAMHSFFHLLLLWCIFHSPC